MVYALKRLFTVTRHFIATTNKLGRLTIKLDGPATRNRTPYEVPMCVGLICTFNVYAKDDTLLVVCNGFSKTWLFEYNYITAKPLRKSSTESLETSKAKTLDILYELLA